MTRGRRTPPATKAEIAAGTREALLEAGATLLREQPVGAVLTQVRAQPVAERAGRTIGAFYHHWDSQDAYHRDLLAYVLDPQRLPSTAVAAETVLVDLPRGLPLEEVVRRAARRNFDSVRDNPYVPLILALWGKQAQDDHVRDLLRAHYRSVTERLVPVYRAFFAVYGLTMRPPYTVEIFAATLTALVEGLTVRAAVEPEVVPLDLPHPGDPAATPADGAAWDLFSATVVGIVRAMTVPAGDA